MTFLGVLSDLFQGLSDFHLDDQKVTQRKLAREFWCFFEWPPHVSVDVFPWYCLRYRTIWLKDGDASVVPRRLSFFCTASYVHPFGLVLCDCFPDLSKTSPIILFVVTWIWVDHFLESGYLANWHHNCCSMGWFPMRWSNPYKTKIICKWVFVGICLHVGNLLSQCSHWTYHHMFIFTPYNHLSGFSRYDVGPPNLTVVSGLIPGYSHSEVESSTRIQFKSEELLGEKQMQRRRPLQKRGVSDRYPRPPLWDKYPKWVRVVYMSVNYLRVLSFILFVQIIIQESY